MPVYDYVLVTEPLLAAQLDALGWRRRQGASDSGNQFHYYRLTDDNRILWGGYDAIYHDGNRIGTELEQRDETATILAESFLTTFPQLGGALHPSLGRRNRVRGLFLPSHCGGWVLS